MWNRKLTRTAGATLMLGAGLGLAKQTGVGEGVDGLEDLVISQIDQASGFLRGCAQFGLNTAELVGGAVLGSLGLRTYRNRIRRSRLKVNPDKDKRGSLLGRIAQAMPGLTAKTVAIGAGAALAAGLMEYSYGFISSLYDYTMSNFQLWADSMQNTIIGAEGFLNNVYDALFNPQEPTVLSKIAKTGVTLPVLLIGAALYRKGVTKKHGDIVSRINIDGWTPYRQRLSYTNLMNKAQRMQRFIGDDDISALHEDDVIIATVTRTEFQTGKTEKIGYITMRYTLDPATQKKKDDKTPDVTPEMIRNIIDDICEAYDHRRRLFGRNLPDDRLPGEQVDKYAKKANIAKKYFGADSEYDMDTFRTIMLYFRSDTNVRTVDPEKVAQKVNRFDAKETGGYFLRTFYGLDGKKLVERATFREDIDATKVHTRGNFNVSFAYDGKLLPVLRFRIRGHTGHDDQDDTDADDEHEDDDHDLDHAEPVQDSNTVRYLQKKDNQRFVFSWLGDLARVAYRDMAFNFDEQWARSGRWVDALSLFRKGWAIRRLGYLTRSVEGQSDDIIVAKVEEVPWLCWSKLPPFWNNNMRIDIYRDVEGYNEGFAIASTLLAEQRREHVKYKNHRIEHILAADREVEPYG